MADGMPAGRLEIEIVAEVARLQQDMARVRKVVDDAGGSIARTGKVANDNIGKMGATSKLAGHHMANLSFQIQDIAVALQGGQKPMTVFMQQGSQIAQIMAQAQIGVFGLIRAVTGMGVAMVASNPLLAAATVAAAGLAAVLGVVTAEINKTSDVTVSMGDVVMGTFDVLREAVETRVTAAFRAMGVEVDDVWAQAALAAKNAINFTIGAMTVLPQVIVSIYDKIGPAFGDAFYSAANLAIEALNTLARGSVVPLNLIIQGLNSAFGTQIPEIVIGGLQKIENPYAGAMGRLGQAGVGAFMGAFRTDYIGGMADAISEAAQARAQSHQAAEQSGAKLGKAAGKAAGQAAGQQFQMSFAEAFAGVAADFKAIQGAHAETGKMEATLKALQQEKDLRELNRHERAQAILQAEEQAALAEKQAEIDAANLSGQAQLAAEYQRQLDLLKEIYAARGEAIDFAAKAEDDARKLALVNDQLAEMENLLGSIGGMGRVFSGIMQGLRTGDFSSLGPVGVLFDILRSGKGEQEKKIEILTKQIQDIFGTGGKFSKTLATGLQGAGIGMTAGAVVAGKNNSQSEQIGSAIGGAIGMAVAGPLGAAVLGALGSLVGGALNGAKKGGVNFSGTAVTGSNFGNAARIDAATESATSMIDALAQMAKELGGTLETVSNISIGLRNDSWRVDPTGAGRVKGAGVVDFGDDAEAAAMYAMKLLIERGVIGGIRASTQNILAAGDDLEAQLQKALKFEGVFKAVEAAGNPFLTQLRELKSEIDDLTAIFAEAGATAEEYAMLQAYIAQQQQALIDQASSSYRSTFFSDAENVAYAKQQISAKLTPMGYGSVDTVPEYKALVAATDPLANPELYGTLMDLADEFGVLQDAAEQAKDALAAEAAAKAAIDQQRSALQVQLLRAQGDAEGALAAERATALAAMDESLRTLQQQVWKAQDIADARDVLAQAYERESGEIEKTVDRMQSLGDSLRDVRAEIYGTGSAAGSYAQQLARLRQVGAMAAMGDETAMGQLGGVIRDFLPAAKSNARTLADYQRAQALAARYADSAIGAADTAVDLAQKQLDQLKAQVEALGVVAEEVVGVEQAIDRLTALLGSTSQGGGGTSKRDDDDAVESRIRDHIERAWRPLHDRLDRQHKVQEQMTVSLNRLARTFGDAEKSGTLRVTIAADETA